jgi:putative transcriptional regulator
VSEHEHGKLGALIIAGLQEAIRHARGEDTGARVVTMEVTARKAYLEPPPYYPPHLLREVRHRLSVSQTIFAQMLGVSASSIRAWEQGKREPEGPARRLIQIADLHPEILRETCGETHPAIGRKASPPRRLRAPATPRPERLAADTDAS